MTNPSPAHDLFLRAQQALQQHQVLSALRLAEEAGRLDPAITGLHALRAQCLAGIGRLPDALAAAEEELRRSVPSPDAVQLRAAIAAAIEQQRAQAAQPRQWQTVLNQQVLGPIESATHRYTYRGHAMIKNPFDLALYPLLLWNLKPATIFEIGSYNGASALWMADLLATYGVETHIHSLDVTKVTAIEHPRITFHEGSGRALADVFPPEMLASSPRPLLVIDDADHTRETSRAVLDYFHPHMRKGEYVVIEDGLTAQGPRDALMEFLPAHADTWAVDPFYCDFFGYNATWCVNGFLKRIG